MTPAVGQDHRRLLGRTIQRLPSAPSCRFGGTEIPLYPIALALAIVLQLMSVSGIGPWAVLRTAVVAVVLALALSAIGRVALGDRDRAGIFALLGILAIMGGRDGRILILTLLAVGVLLAERHLSRPGTGRRPIRWHRIGRGMATISLALVVVIGAQGVSSGAVGVWLRSVTAEGPLRSAPSVAPGDPSSPDIYVLLLDGYARADVLEDVFGVDERPFLTALEERGLAVSDRARSNYALTAQTLASMFDLTLLEDQPAFGDLLAGRSREPGGAIVRRVINDNALFDRLHGRGYETWSISSGFEEVAVREADHFIDTGQLNEFEVSMLRRTVLGDVLTLVDADAVSGAYRGRLVDSLAALTDVARVASDRHKFVFAHLASPHPPWVFTAGGQPRTVAGIDAIYADTPASTGLTTEELKAGYGGAVEWLHDPVIEAIDAIDAASELPPVIVVFGDHGSWIGADDADLRLRFLPLLAVRVPGVEAPLPDDATLVEVFPTILNTLFQDGLPVVADAPSWMFRGDDEYDHVEVPDPNAALPAP